MSWLILPSLSLPPTTDVWGVFVRLLGVVYLVAFASLAPQVLAIAGSRGITPVARMLDAHRRDFPLRRRLAYLPTLLWLSPSDRMLRALTIVGMAAAGVVVWGGEWSRAALLVCWLAYLSLDAAIDLLYPWDCLLFEAGFLALFLPTTLPLPALAATAVPPAIVVFAYQLLLFRLILGFGKTKFTGQTRKDRGYLREFFIDQPLPSPLGWLGHRLPGGVLAAGLGFLFLVEVLLPPLLFLPGWPRLLAGAGIAALMLGIQIGGSFGHFNLLTISLCVTLLDAETTLLDVDLASVAAAPATHLALGGWMALGVLYFPFNNWCTRSWSHWPAWRNLRGRVGPRLVAAARFVAPFRVIHSFGVFPPQTTPGVKFIPVIEATRDGTEWREYHYRFLPCDEQSPPRFVAPHHPRWDHYAFYEGYGMQPGSFTASVVGGSNPYHFCDWSPFDRLMQRVLEGSPETRVFFRADPFAGEGPPLRARVTLYMLEPLTPAERARTGRWWRRTRLGPHRPERGREDWRWDAWPADPLHFHWDDVFRAESAPLVADFRAAARRADGIQELEAAAARALERLGGAPDAVARFWSEFLPVAGRPSPADWRELPGAVEEARARFTPAELRDFERVDALLARALAARHERRVFGDPADYFPLPSYFHVGMLCQTMILRGRDAYARALGDDAFMMEGARRLAIAEGTWLWGVLRYDTMLSQARRLRVTHSIAPQNPQPVLPGFLHLLPFVAGELYDPAVETVPRFARQVSDGRWTLHGFEPEPALPGRVRVPALGPLETPAPR